MSLNPIFWSLLMLAAGCAGMNLPKAVTQEGVSAQREKRNQEGQRQFRQQRDFAEYEAAKTRWIEQRDAKGCREGLEKLLARNPQHGNAHLLLAELLLTEDDPQGAFDHAKAALAISPNEGHTQYMMAVVLDTLEQTDKALRYYERATKMAPENETFLAAYQAAHGVGPEADRDSKTTMLNIMKPDAAPASTPAGQANSTLLAGYTDSSSDAEKDWAGSQVLLAKAAAALRANQPDLAVKRLVPAVEQFPTSAALYRMLGVAYYRIGDYQSSQVALQQALSLDKSSALSYLLLGCTLAKLGQNESAEAHFRQARILDPRHRVSR